LKTKARAERYEIFEKFFTYKMEKRISVSEHAIKITGYTHLNHLGCNI
jgi:hypothetical protein